MWQALQSWVGITVIFSIVTSVVGITLATVMIVRMPENQFLEGHSHGGHRHPILHYLWVFGKNLLGLAIIVAGVAMAILPGPGLLAILIGVSIVDIPGKHWLLQRGLQLRSVRRSLNWVRRKAGCSPLKFPPRPQSHQA